MQGEFMFFWSVFVPAVMITGSIIITYSLYRHFAGKLDQEHKKAHTDQS